MCIGLMLIGGMLVCASLLSVDVFWFIGLMWGGCGLFCVLCGVFCFVWGGVVNRFWLLKRVGVLVGSKLSSCRRVGYIFIVEVGLISVFWGIFGFVSISVLFCFWLWFWVCWYFVFGSSFLVVIVRCMVWFSWFIYWLMIRFSYLYVGVMVFGNCILVCVCN